MERMTVEQALEAIDDLLTESRGDCGEELDFCVTCSVRTKALATLRAELDGLRAERRKWAAEEMRGLVPEEENEGRSETYPYSFDDTAPGFNRCRAETLANIEKWESSNG